MARKKTEGKPTMPATAAKEKLRAVKLELPEDVHKLLRLEAAKQDTSLGELARQFVTEALKRPRRGRGEGAGE
jgi:predicted HicB family RNase H-like nuclease